MIELMIAVAVLLVLAVLFGLEGLFELLFRFWWAVAAVVIFLVLGTSLFAFLLIAGVLVVFVGALAFFSDGDIFDFNISSRRSNGGKSRRRSKNRRDGGGFFDDFDLDD